MQNKFKRKKFYIRYILAFLLVILSIVLFRKQLLRRIGSYLIISDLLHPVDVIHVIAGDDYRAEYAIQLYQQGLAKTIFFTGGFCKYHGWYHGIHGQQFAFQKGVPSEAVTYNDSTVTSTFDETVLLKEWIDQNDEPIHSVMVVSDPFHMLRAKWTNEFVLGKNIEVLMAPVPFDKNPFSEQWWTDQASREYVKEEYIKLVYYFFRYKLSMKWLAVYDTE